MLLLPLTAVQLLWINFLGDGPPALALSVDRTPGQMDRPPRPRGAGGALIDRASAGFIFGTGAIKGAIGIGLLVLMPELGYGAIAIQTVLFLYESIGKLVSVYPSRRRGRGGPANAALHVAVVAGTAIQVLTLAVPSLRRMLGLEVLDARALLIVAGTVGLTWIAANAVRVVVHARNVIPDAAVPVSSAHV
jgi:Ca2+-transporting ATPase